ncbi:MAG: hypothetical protein ACI91J_000144, partial [Yoonia sp.]
MGALAWPYRKQYFTGCESTDRMERDEECEMEGG